MLGTKPTGSGQEVDVVCAEVLPSCGHSGDGTSKGREAEGDRRWSPNFRAGGEQEAGALTPPQTADEGLT